MQKPSLPTRDCNSLPGWDKVVLRIHDGILPKHLPIVQYVACLKGVASTTVYNLRVRARLAERTHDPLNMCVQNLTYMGKAPCQVKEATRKSLGRSGEAS